MKRTRISKQPRLRHQLRPHRIELDVSNNVSSLLGRSHPPIVGFNLPEPLTSSAQRRIRLLGRNPLDILRNPWRRHSRLDQKMDVIRHHCKSDEVVPSADSIAVLHHSRYALSDRGLLQPVRTMSRAPQFAIRCNETPSVTAEMQWKCACQSECDEERWSVRLEVRKLAAILHVIAVPRMGERSQFFVQAKACVTPAPGD